MSSELPLLISPLKRLSPRELPNPSFLSPGVVGCAVAPPKEKLPNAPVEGNPADCGAADQGEEGPLIAALNGPAVVRLNDPNDELVSNPLSIFSPSLNLSPTPVLDALSLKSVLRLIKEGDGVDP